MSNLPNRTVGVIVSFEAEDPDWPLSRVKGTIRDDRDGILYKFNEKTFVGWFEGLPLLGKRVRFLATNGAPGYVAEDVELE
ncbi:hypothetical protein [Pseudomonas sp. PB3P13]